MSCKGCMTPCLVENMDVRCPCRTCLVKVTCLSVCDDWDIFWEIWKQENDFVFNERKLYD